MEGTASLSRGHYIIVAVMALLLLSSCHFIVTLLYLHSLMWRFCLGITSINVIAVHMASLWHGASIIAAVRALPLLLRYRPLIEYDMMLLPIGAHHSHIILYPLLYYPGKYSTSAARGAMCL